MRTYCTAQRTTQCSVVTKSAYMHMYSWFPLLYSKPRQCCKASIHVALVVKNPPSVQETGVQSLGLEDPLEEEMATHSSILGWKIPWAEESGALPFTDSRKVRHDWEMDTLMKILKNTTNNSAQSALRLQLFPLSYVTSVNDFSCMYGVASMINKGKTKCFMMFVQRWKENKLSRLPSVTQM